MFTVPICTGARGTRCSTWMIVSSAPRSPELFSGSTRDLADTCCTESHTISGILKSRSGPGTFISLRSKSWAVLPTLRCGIRKSGAMSSSPAAHCWKTGHRVSVPCFAEVRRQALRGRRTLTGLHTGVAQRIRDAHIVRVKNASDCDLPLRSSTSSPSRRSSQPHQREGFPAFARLTLLRDNCALSHAAAPEKIP